MNQHDLSGFRLNPGLIYLNHAGVGPWPARTAGAVATFAGDNIRHGAAHYPDWLLVAQRLRAQLAALIGAAGSDDIALLKNTSEDISLVAAGLAWQADIFHALRAQGVICANVAVASGCRRISI